MDQVKIGAFIAELRRNHNWTQQQLGDKVGVTNKTVSRWENGNYMPDIEMLQILSQEFQISINELLAGQRLSDEEFRKSADENILAVSKQSAFSFLEKKQFWIKKWRKEHIGLFVILVLVNILCIVLSVVLNQPVLIAWMGILLVVEYAWQNNRMMIYVENHLYEKNFQSPADEIPKRS